MVLGNNTIIQYLDPWGHLKPNKPYLTLNPQPLGPIDPKPIYAKVPELQQKVIHEPGTSAISKNIPLSEVWEELGSGLG